MDDIPTPIVAYTPHPFCGVDVTIERSGLSNDSSHPGIVDGHYTNKALLPELYGV